MKKNSNSIFEIPTWVWVVSILTLFLCIYTYTESDIYYCYGDTSFLASWANNLRIIGYTFEIVYVLGLIFCFIDHGEHKIDAFSSTLYIFKKIVLYSAIIIIGLFIINFIAYVYASIINGAAINFENKWTEDMIIVPIIASPLKSGLIISFLIFLRTVFNGLIVISIGELFKKRFVGLIVVLICLFALGFNSVQFFNNINIFPYQFANAEHLYILYGNACRDSYMLTPISLASAIAYFVCIIIAAFVLLKLIIELSSKKKKQKHAMTEIKDKIGIGILRGLGSKSFWAYTIILITCYLFSYYFVSSWENSFVDNFSCNYLLTYIMPMLGISAIGLTRWREMKALGEEDELSIKRYIQKVLSSAIVAGIGAVLATVLVAGLSYIITPEGEMGFIFVLNFTMRMFICAFIFTIISFGILTITQSEAAAISLPVVYMIYALGGVYHIAGSSNIELFRNIVPMIQVNGYKYEPLDDYSNLISALICGIILVYIGFLRLRWQANKSNEGVRR